MRILFVTQTYPRFKGDTNGPFIEQLAVALLNLGHEVTTIVPHAIMVPPTRHHAGVRVESFRYLPACWECIGYSGTLRKDTHVAWASKLAAPFYLWGVRRAVQRALRRDHFDVFHAHWLVPNAVALTGAPLPPSYIISMHGSDVFLAERVYFRPWATREIRRCTYLTGSSPEFIQRAQHLGLPESRGRVVPYGVDGDKFSPRQGDGHVWRERLGISGKDLLLLGVGRMVDKKGFQYLLDAAPDILSDHPNLHIVLAGDGDRLADFRERVYSMQERIHLPGAVSHDELPSLLQAADMFTLPAIHDQSGNVDGLPNVVLEAMASGLPVVASAISGIPMAVTDQVSGLLVPEKDSRALRNAVGRLASDPSLRKLLARGARERVLQAFTWEAVARQFVDLYENNEKAASET